MKSAVETLSPTRVRLTVEVPFDELRPSVDQAYREIARQIRVRGFRPGKVPPRLVDQQVGRGTVLNEAIQHALPQLYGTAVRENELEVLGHPDVEVTELADGDRLAFRVEVDVRPQFELPDYEGLEVAVTDAEPSDDQVDEQVEAMRERFATLSTVERAASAGDYVTLDLSASVDGEPVEDAAATGLSYAVGSGGLVEGLDDALEGLAVGESRTFATSLRAGDHAGATAQATVTLRSVRVKELPALDDEFAQTASEFDTLEELRADVRARLERVGRLQQGLRAREAVLDRLLELVDVPVPEHVFGDELAYRRQAMDQQLQAYGMTKQAYAESLSQPVEQLDAELEEAARRAIRSQFVLDAIAEREQVQVEQADLTDALLRRAQRLGRPPEQVVREVVEGGGLPSLMSEVMRTKALALVLDAARVSDASGRPVDLEALTEAANAAAAEMAGDDELDEYDDELDEYDDDDGDDLDDGDEPGEDRGEQPVAP